MSIEITLKFVLDENNSSNESVEAYKSLFADTEERDDVAVDLINDNEFSVTVTASTQDAEAFSMLCGLEHKILVDDDEDDAVEEVEAVKE